MKIKRDPSRTTILRRKFEIDLRKRLINISKAIKNFIVTEDEFGLKKPKPISLLQRTYQFRTSSQKLKVFQDWLRNQINDGFLAVRVGKNWSDVYVESAYKKGLERAYLDTHKKQFAVQPVDKYIGGREQFLQATFWAPETIEKIQLLATRTFEELKGVSGAMSQQINRILAEGLTNGYGPEKIARNMDNAIKKIDRTRARVIARTEVIHAHAEGQLDGFKKLGIDEVSAEVEWLTAGDAKVCEQCASMEGMRYKIDEAHGLIPLHPNCFANPKTKITTKDGYKFIKDIKIGDMVLTQFMRYRPVTELYHTQIRNIDNWDTYIHGIEIIELIPENTNKPILITPNHLLRIKDKIVNDEIISWKSAQDLYFNTDCPIEKYRKYPTGDLIVINKGKELIYSKIKQCSKADMRNWDKTFWVYNFSVKGDESYFAEDILVHNCRCAWIPVV